MIKNKTYIFVTVSEEKNKSQKIDFLIFWENCQFQKTILIIFKVI